MKKLLAITTFAFIALASVTSFASPPAEKEHAKYELVKDYSFTSDVVVTSLENRHVVVKESIQTSLFYVLAPKKFEAKFEPVVAVPWVIPKTVSSFGIPANTKTNTYKGFAYVPPLNIRSTI